MVIAHRSRVIAGKESADYGDLLAATRDGVSVLIEQLERVKPRGVLAGKHQRGAAPVLVNEPNGDAITDPFANERPAASRETAGSAQNAHWTRRRQAVSSPPILMLGHRPNVLAPDCHRHLSTLFICDALLESGPHARHVAMDPYQERAALPGPRTSFAGAGLQILEDAGLRDLVEFYGEESQLRSGGVVFVDDTQLPPISRAVRYFIANLGWALEEEGREGTCDAWQVLRTGPEELHHRPYAQFVDGREPR